MDQALKDLVSFASTATPATIFALMWFLERRSRERAETKLEDYMERVITISEKYSAAMQTMNTLLGGPRQ